MRFRITSVKSHSGQEGLRSLGIHSYNPEAMYRPALCFTSEKCVTFPSPVNVKSELLVAPYLLSLALHKMFMVNVPDFKADINSFMFRMCEARCLNIENQTKLCQNPSNLCNPLFILLVQMLTSHA